MYTISTPSGTIRSDGVVVPDDDSKPEYLAYVAFLQQGGAPVQIADQVNPASKPHVTCTPWQFRKALNARGLREQVDALVASLDQDSRDGYEYATSWDSDHPLLITNLPTLGWTADDLHEFIGFASTLTQTSGA